MITNRWFSILSIMNEGLTNRVMSIMGMFHYKTFGKIFLAEYHFIDDFNV